VGLHGSFVCSWVDVNVVDGSVTLVLDNSIAGGDSEEVFTLFGLERLHLIGLDGEFGGDFILLLLVFKFIEDGALLDVSVIEEHVKG